jgi:hypothetical protein
MEKPTAHNNQYMGTTKLPKVSHNLQAAEITSKSSNKCSKNNGSQKRDGSLN